MFLQKKKLLSQLKKLNVDPKKVKCIDNNLPVKDWKKVAGVIKSHGQVFAYSDEIQSELAANLKSI